MGILMKKLVLLATALAMISGSALAADMAVKAVKAPPPAPVDPWDIAFGGAILFDYIFRGVRPTFGAFAFDIGVWGYLYPGGTCFFGAPFDTAGKPLSAECATNFLL